MVVRTPTTQLTHDQATEKWRTKIFELRNEANAHRRNAEAIPGNVGEAQAEAFGIDLACNIVEEVLADLGLCDPDIEQRLEARQGEEAALQEHIHNVLTGRENPAPGFFPGYRGGHVSMEQLQEMAAHYRVKTTSGRRGPEGAIMDPRQPGYPQTHMTPQGTVIFDANGQPIPPRNQPQPGPYDAPGRPAPPPPPPPPPPRPGPDPSLEERMARLESQNAELAQQLQATVQVLRQMFPAPAAPPPPVPPFNPQDPRFQGYTPPSPFQGDPGPYGP